LDAPTDGELLNKVASAGSQTSFEELFRRHAGMVLGQCRRLLADAQDAEDAAQAVFLVLSVKARSLRRRSTVAGWLHRVAWHVCRNAKRAKNVRKTHERQAAGSRQQFSNDNSSGQARIQDVLDEEMERLPEKYRLPLLLFHLEGRSIEEISALTVLRASTVGTRLSRGREILRQRMVQRGIVVTTVTSAAALSAAGASAAVPATWIPTLAQSAQAFAAGRPLQGGLLTPQAAALARGGLHLLQVAKLKVVIGATVTTFLCSGGVTAIVLLMMASQRSSQRREPGPRDEHVQATVDDSFEKARQAALAQVHTERIPKEIVDAMRQREAAIVSFDLRWRMHFTNGARDPSAHAIEVIAGDQDIRRLKEFAKNWPPNRLLIAGPNFRWETTIVGTKNPVIYAYDGHRLRHYGSGSGVVREATPSEAASRVLPNVNLIAPQFVFRPLSRIPQHDQTIVFENRTQNVCGRPCVSLRYEDPTSPGDQWQCYLDRERRWVPVKLQQRRDGYLAIEVTISSVTVDAKYGPVPAAWVTTLYRRNGSILYDWSTVVEDCHFNQAVPKREFDFPFPPGTVVLPPPKPVVLGPQTRKEPIYNPKADAKADIKAALERAKREHKRVLLDFGGNWCGWCYLLHDVLLQNQRLADLAKNGFVLVLVDIDTNHGLFDQYVPKASQLGFPYLTVLDADGHVLKNQETDPLEDGMKYDLDKVRAFLAQWSPPRPSAL
jgi:RNA polymerase sigma factor (sigma-70 family)